jgi:hypothetical protein
MMACGRPAWLIALAAAPACSFPHHFVPPAIDAAVDAIQIAVDAGPDASTLCPAGASPAYTVIDLGPGYAFALDGFVVGGIDTRNVGALWTVDPTSMTIDQIELPLASDVAGVSSSLAIGEEGFSRSAYWSLSGDTVSEPQTLAGPVNAPLVSTDGVSGSTIVGWATDVSSIASAEMWSIAGSAITGPTALPALPGFAAGSAYAIEGTLVVGQSFSVLGGSGQATAWQLPAATPVAIPNGPLSATQLVPVGVSATAIVGYIAASAQIAVMWPVAGDGTIGNPVTLPPFAGDSGSVAYGAVGSAVIGVSTYQQLDGGMCTRLVRWTEDGASWVIDDVTPMGWAVANAGAVDPTGNIAISGASGSGQSEALLLVPATP